MKQLLWRFFMPDDATGSSTPTPSETTPTPGIPDGDVDLLNLSKFLLTVWEANPLIILIWIKIGEAANLVQAFEQYLNQRMKASGNRATITQNLENLQAEIDENEEFVKGYIIGKYGPKNASSHYNTFGMMHKNDGWGLPDDQDERSKGLELLIAALAAEGFGGNEYGTLYWTNVKAHYDDNLAASKTADATISASAGNKNAYRVQIVEWLVALRFVLRGNYPKTYQSVWRQWGFIKQDY